MAVNIIWVLLIIIVGAVIGLGGKSMKKKEDDIWDSMDGECTFWWFLGEVLGVVLILYILVSL